MLKNRKSARLGDICVEFKEFNPTTKQWILELFNEIRSTYKLPKTWRKSHVIALLKPGKEPTSSKNIPVGITSMSNTQSLRKNSSQSRNRTFDENLIQEQAYFRKR